jgi:hypothetical protein
MKALERATDSSTNRAAFRRFRRAGLVLNPGVFPPVSALRDGDLMTRIAKSQLPEAEPSIEGWLDPENHSNDTRRPIFGFLNRGFLAIPKRSSLETIPSFVSGW